MKKLIIKPRLLTGIISVRCSELSNIWEGFCTLVISQIFMLYSLADNYKKRGDENRWVLDAGFLCLCALGQTGQREGINRSMSCDRVSSNSLGRHTKHVHPHTDTHKHRQWGVPATLIGCCCQGSQCSGLFKKKRDLRHETQDWCYPSCQDIEQSTVW